VLEAIVGRALEDALALDLFACILYLYSVNSHQSFV